MNTAPRYSPTAARLRPFPGARAWDTTNPLIYLGTITGVRRAKKRRGALVCPTDIDPMAFEWPARGLSVTVIDYCGDSKRAVRLAQALIRDGAALVACLGEGWTSYHKQHEVTP